MEKLFMTEDRTLGLRIRNRKNIEEKESISNIRYYFILLRNIKDHILEGHQG